MRLPTVSLCIWLNLPASPPFLCGGDLSSPLRESRGRGHMTLSLDYIWHSLFPFSVLAIKLSKINSFEIYLKHSLTVVAEISDNYLVIYEVNCLYFDTTRLTEIAFHFIPLFDHEICASSNRVSIPFSSITIFLFSSLFSAWSFFTFARR